MIHYATKKERKKYLLWDGRLLLRPKLVAIVGATQIKNNIYSLYIYSYIKKVCFFLSLTYNKFKCVLMCSVCCVHLYTCKHVRCVHLYTCKHVCCVHLYACKHVCCVHLYTCKHVCCVHLYTCKHVCCVHLYTCKHVCCVHLYTCKHVCCVHLYTCKHVCCVHLYTCKHVLNSICMNCVTFICKVFGIT